MAGFGPGEKVQVKVVRDGQVLTFPVLLGVKKEKPIFTSLPPIQNGLDLGMDVSPITDDLTTQYKLEDQEGILVTKVGRQSIAYSEAVSYTHLTLPTILIV